MATDVARSERYAEVVELRREGLTQAEVAVALGISPSYVSELERDPDGSAAMARKARYGGVCERCGNRTDGSAGRAKAPRFCSPCNHALREPPHGTASRYTSEKWACRCEPCTTAATEAHRLLKGRTPPSHGYSGYVNYGCRCAICTRANTERCYGTSIRWARHRASVATST